MAGSTYSSNLKIELMTTGENSGTWGDVTNTNLGTALEQAVIGLGNPDYASDANLTISITNSNASQAARCLVLNVTSTFGSLTATRELVVPTIQKQYIVQNNTTGGQSITVKTSAGTGITVPNGRKAHLYVDGTNVIQMFDFVNLSGGTIDNMTIGATTASSGKFTTLNASGATTLDGTVALGNAAADIITVPGTIGSNLIFTDNTYDIGASGATRPRNLFLAGAATIGGNLSVGGTLTLTGGVNLNGNVTVGDSAADTLTINATITSNLLFTDNTYDIGASGATRPRNLFLAGNATIGGNQTLTGSLTVDSTTDSSSTTTGSIQTDGGLGVAKSMFLGQNLNVAGTSTLTGNVGIGAANLSGTAKLTVSDTALLSTYFGTSQRFLQLAYDTATTSAWSFGNYDQNVGAVTTDFAFSYYNGTIWSKPNALRLRASGNVSMNAGNLSVASTDSNPWGSGFNAVQTYDLTAGSFAGSGYAGYVLSNTYNNGTNWVRVGASFASAFYTQFDGGHQFAYAAAGSAGSNISSWTTALQTDKSGGVTIPGYVGINSTPSSSFALRIGNNGAQIRLQRASDIRYRSDLQVSAGQLEINAYDDTAAVYMAGLYTFSNHTWNYGTATQATAATINTSGVFGTVFDAYFNSVRAGRGGGNVSNNTAFGAGALNGSTTGQGNTAIGYGAGGNISSSPYNTAVGLNALGSSSGPVTGADGSTAIGVNALFNLTSGNKNTAVGRDAGYSSTTSTGNVYLGYGAGFTNNNNGNTFIGFEAGKIYTGSNSVFLGNLAGAASTTGNYNTFLGDESGYGHTTGGNNTFVGVGAAYGANTLTSTLVIGQYNIDSSRGPGESLTSGSNNTYVGGFTGNQNSLDTRGLSQQVVISDGAGYPVFHNNVSKIATNNFGHIDVTFNSTTTGNVLAVASGTSVSLFGGGNNFSGLLLINDISTTGSAALFIVGGQAAVFKISESSSSNHFQATSTPTGNTTGCYMSGNAFTITQNSGGTTNYRIIALRTRVSL